MTNLNINTDITYTDIETGSLIVSNNYQAYNFIGASIDFDFQVDGNTYQGTLQTGHTYHLNDYSLPSNSLWLYEGDDLLEKMDQAYESDFDNNEFISELNADLELNYSEVEWLQIYHSFNDAVSQAQQIVDEAEQEADEEIENDEHYYVKIIEMEETGVVGGVLQKQQSEESYVLRFDSEDEADKEIERREASGDHAYYVNKEQGISERH